MLAVRCRLGDGIVSSVLFAVFFMISISDVVAHGLCFIFVVPAARRTRQRFGPGRE